MAEHFKISLSDSESVSGLYYPADETKQRAVTLTLGHGAGAGQTSGFMVLFAGGLAERGLDVVTFNFSYTERGRHAPDPGPKLESCYLSVIEAVRTRHGLERNKLIIGGKSMGGRIASQAAAKVAGTPEDHIDGLVFLGYPLHPPGKPEQLRDKHLSKILAPMLFVQGSRDAFGTPDELKPVLAGVKALHTLYPIESGDHSFKVPKKVGTPQDKVYSDIMDKIADWAQEVARADSSA